MTEGERKRLEPIGTEVVFIAQHVVMGRPTSTKETTMALKIKVELGWMRDFSINDRACWTITAPVGLPFVLGEESNVMPFTDDDDGDCRIYF